MSSMNRLPASKHLAFLFKLCKCGLSSSRQEKNVPLKKASLVSVYPELDSIPTGL
jgi:hypothetical protein